LPMGSFRRRFARGLGSTTQPLRSSSITEPSSLLRAAPPLCSVRYSGPCGVRRLDVSLGNRSERFSRSAQEPG
jgi:hypothetical protein